MERDTRETVEADYRYMISDALLDSMLAGELTADEALEQYKQETDDARSEQAVDQPH